LTVVDIDTDQLVSSLCTALAIATPLDDAREADPRLRSFNESFVAPRLERLGARVTFDAIGNLTGYVDGSGSPLMLASYVMTHPAGTMPSAFEPQLVTADFGVGPEPAVRGRGACEQRAGMIAVLAALEACAGQAAHRPVIISSLVSGESGSHDAIASAVGNLERQPDAAVVAVCTNNTVVIGHKGRVDVELRTIGRAAHSSSPQLGVNAAEAMVTLLPAVLATRANVPQHPALGTATVTLIDLQSGPRGSHTVPGYCTATLDVRLLPGDDAASVSSQLTAAARAGRDGALEVRQGNAMLPAQVPESAAIVQELRAACMRAAGESAALRWFAASTDMGYLNSVGIPAVCFGPGDERLAHTDDDQVAVSQLAEAARVYAELIAGPPSSQIPPR
jgi:acetylornithine deacetylase/succinyl-diaminopimelate desuccinylase-like protein